MPCRPPASLLAAATLLAAAAFLAAVPAAAQDFNAAPPNAPGQQPAFAGQTRAPVIADPVTLQAETIVSRLANPWGMDQLPDGSWLVTERPGRMRIISPEGDRSQPIDGLPEVFAGGQGGLLDVTVRDDFAETRRVWWSYAEPRDGPTNATAVATGMLSRGRDPDGGCRGDLPPGAGLGFVCAFRLAPGLRQ
jgi:glucose/arabinose dehydrogenase